jgi:glycosyltransferase involved in cell wall biosynthesis
MKVIILFEESIHYGLAAASRVICYAKGLAHNNCETEIWMPYAYTKNDKSNISSEGMHNGVTYRYSSFLDFNPFKTFKYPFGQVLAYYYLWTGYCKLLWNLSKRKNKVQIIYIYKSGLFFTILIFLLNNKKVLVSELCEIPYLGSKSFTNRISRIVRENIIFPLFDAFVVISENLFIYIQNYKSPKALLIKVPVLYDEIDSKNISGSSKFNLPGYPYILHNGTLSDRKDGILGMIEAFSLAINKLDTPIIFVMTGYIEYSPDKKRIFELIEKLNLKDKIIFTGFLTRHEITILQKNASLAILNKPDNEQNSYNFPTKLAEYLGNGIPTIATKIGEIKNYLTDNVDIYFVKNAEPASIAEKIIDAFTNEEKRKLISQNGKKIAINEFNPVYQGKRMCDFFNTLLSKKNR